MKSILAFATLAAVMTFCNLFDKPQPSSDAGSSEERSGKPQRPPTAKPTMDRETVKAELVKLENEMTEAALNGDITLLAKNTTDDFELTGVDGKVQNKNQALADIKREKNIKSWSITEAELVSFSEDSAVLRYIQNVTLKTGQSGRARVTDSFVKKDGRWLVKSEQQTMIR